MTTSNVERTYTDADLDQIFAGTLPVPTDEEGLAALLRLLNVTRWHRIEDLLQKQTDSNPDMIDQFDRVAAEVRHALYTEKLRAQLRLDLAGAQDSARAVLKTLDVLSGNEIYDVEYAEGGTDAADMRRFLEDAARLLRAAERANPVKADG